MVGATSVSSMASMIDSSDMSSCSSEFSGNSSDSEKAMDSVDEFLEEVRMRAGISRVRARAVSHESHDPRPSDLAPHHPPYPSLPHSAADEEATRSSFDGRAEGGGPQRLPGERGRLRPDGSVDVRPRHIRRGRFRIRPARRGRELGRVVLTRDPACCSRPPGPAPSLRSPMPSFPIPSSSFLPGNPLLSLRAAQPLGVWHQHIPICSRPPYRIPSDRAPISEADPQISALPVQYLQPQQLGSPQPVRPRRAQICTDLFMRTYDLRRPPASNSY